MRCVASASKHIACAVHVTIGIETDSDGHTWGGWLADAIQAMAQQSPMMDGESDELRQAMPLQLFRPESTARDVSALPSYPRRILGKSKIRILIQRVEMAVSTL